MINSGRLVAKSPKIASKIQPLTVNYKPIPLTPTRVRWFYKDETTKRWVPFNGFDSIAIETYYLRLKQLQSEAETKGCADETFDDFKPLIVREGLFEIDVVTKQCYPVYWESVNGPSDILRGTWFKDPGGPNSVPIDDPVMLEQLDITHAYLSHKLLEFASSSDADSADVGCDGGYSEQAPTSGPSLLAADRLRCVYTLKFADCHVDWYSPDEACLYVETATFYIRQKLGMQKVGTRLARGYHEEAEPTAVPPTYSHLCFVVHGMGQKYLKGSIIPSCDGIRETSKKLIDSYFPDVRASERQVQFLPVEWRNSLRLDGNTLDSITLDNLTRLRSFLNGTFMDIMYYTSPLYRYEISEGLRFELNRLYCLFCERHPYFEGQGGKVSILAHSLGCVISYDLITGWIEPVPSHLNSCPLAKPKWSSGAQEPAPCSHPVAEVGDEDDDSSVLLAKLEAAKEVVKCLETQLESRQRGVSIADVTADNSHSLLFASRLENLFCMGSPLAVYLTLRGVRPGQTGSPETVMPRSKCTHIYNIFHPADPVAYRLEPLVLGSYSEIAPVEIYRCTDAGKMPYHLVHALAVANTAAAASPAGAATRHSALNGLFQVDQPQRGTPPSGLTSDSMSGISNTSAESLQSIGSRFSRHLPLTSFMLGFFRSSSDSLAPTTHAETETELRGASLLPSSAEPPRMRFRVGSEEEEEEEGDEEMLSPEAVGPAAAAASSSPRAERASEETGVRVPLEYRMDYRLKESRYEASYLSALTVHTGYWANADLVMFVLMHCFPDSTPLDSPMTPL